MLAIFLYQKKSLCEDSKVLLGTQLQQKNKFLLKEAQKEAQKVYKMDSYRSSPLPSVIIIMLQTYIMF